MDGLRREERNVEEGVRALEVMPLTCCRLQLLALVVCYKAIGTVFQCEE